MTSNSHPVWSEHEIAALRSIFPFGSWVEIKAALPKRTRSAVKNYAHKIGLRREVSKRVVWSDAEVTTLRRLWAWADEDEIEAALPGRSFVTAQKMACALRIRRHTIGTRKNTRFVHPVIRQLRAARERQNLNRVQLAAKMGYHQNNLLAWELGKARPYFHHASDLADALGFELVLKEKRLDDLVIPWPERQKLMAGRS